MTPGRTRVVSVHRLRRTAQKRERDLTDLLDARLHGRALSPMPPRLLRLRYAAPEWATGVRVEKAGRFQWAVVATEGRGR